MGLSAIRARQLAVGRGQTAVLQGIDLELAAGERLALVGPNGSGKTTLLRALAGLDRPLAGTISWQGAPLPPSAERVRHLGVVFQSESPAPYTVSELVTLGLGLDGPPSSQQSAVVDKALDRMDLASLGHRRCSTISGGEWQRATVARALVAGPRLLLLDEPTSHLDPARRAELLQLLERLRGQVAVVLATHDLECAAGCDRVALLARGRLTALGPPATVMTPGRLASALGVRIRRLDDPGGGPPFLRVEGPA